MAPQDKWDMANDDVDSLGNLLIELGFVTKADLTEAVKIQKAAQPRLGQILVKMNKLTEDQLREALAVQRIRMGKASPREVIIYQQRRSEKIAAEIKSSANELDICASQVLAEGGLLITS